MEKPLEIIHISGNPGSGKSTLGDEFKGRKGVYVLDTDELVTAIAEKKLLKYRDKGQDKKAQEYWKEFTKAGLSEAHIKAREQGAKLLLIVGILNNFSPDGGILPLPWRRAQKLFLDVPSDIILKRFYTRLAGIEQSYWKDLASGKHVLPSSKEVLESNEKDEKWHLAHGYKMATLSEVKKAIKEALSG